MITLKRTNDRPVTFDGREIASANSRQTTGPGEQRWYELTLYQAMDGRYVAHAGYRTQWQGEHETDAVIVSQSPDTLIEQLREQFAEPHLSMPPGERYAERRAHVFATLRAAYTAAVTELFNALPAEPL